jgi:hypothetical protein
MTDTKGRSDRGEQRQPDIVLLHENYADSPTNANRLRRTPDNIGREAYRRTINQAHYRNDVRSRKLRGPRLMIDSERFDRA